MPKQKNLTLEKRKTQEKLFGVWNRFREQNKRYYFFTLQAKQKTLEKLQNATARS